MPDNPDPAPPYFCQAKVAPIVATLYCRNPKCRHDLEPVFVDDSGETYITGANGTPMYYSRLMCGLCGKERTFESGYFPKPID